MPGGDIHPLYLRFADPEVEAVFETYRIRHTAKLNRIWMVCGCVAIASFGPIEWLALLAATLNLAWFIRYLLLLPLIVALVVWSWPARVRPLHNTTRVAAIALVHLSNWVLFTTAPAAIADIYYLFGIAIIVYTHGYVFLRFAYTAPVGWLASLVYIATMAANPQLTLDDLLVRGGILLTIILAITFNHYHQEVYARRDFRRGLSLRESLRRQLELATAEEQANAAKSHFLAMMSHELRTPLNAIIGFAQMIEGEMMGPLDNRTYRDYAGDIRNSGGHLLQLIDGILDLAKIEAGRLELTEEVVDLEELVRASVDLATSRDLLDGAPVRVDLDPALPRLRADGFKVRQILINILSNARKFTPADGEIRISGRPGPNGGLSLAVADTGPGIAAADQQRVFEPFGQAEGGLTRRFDGTGLGLTLARMLAELHDAELELTSSPGAGTTVRIDFPAERIITDATNGPSPPP
ncbi:MAG: ATP-binding protein [Alphaproteobacteria bacterium]|nr:ATP-binding protein [Alphaproteobacteria bacterium]